VLFNFDTSSNCLVTERRMNITGITVISSILGSLAGLLALSGKAMLFSENHFHKVRKTLLQKETIKRLRNKRKYLKTMASDCEVDCPNIPETSASTDRRYLVRKF
jgi:hypothetical protein